MNRITYIDLIKGFAIFLVVWGHIDTIQPIKSVIYSFHMPLFFILSGFFMNFQKGARVNVKKLLRNLIIPYFATGLFIRICTLIIDYYNGNALDYKDLLSLPLVLWKWDNEVVSVGAIWFLFVLFLGKIYISFCYRSKFFITIISIGAFLSLLVTKQTQIVFPFGIQQMLSSVPFLYIGYLIKQKNMLDCKLSFVSLFSILIPLLFYSRSNAVAMRINSFPYTAYIFSSVISYLIMVLFKKIDEKTDSIIRLFCDFFAWCGRFSLVILCIHSVEARFHWVNLPHNLWGIELVLRFSYIVILTYLFTKISITKKIFNIK